MGATTGATLCKWGNSQGNPNSTSEALRSRHGAARALRHEGRRVLRDPDLGGEPRADTPLLRPRQQPHGTGPAAQACLGVPRGRSRPPPRGGGTSRALPGAVAPGDGRTRRVPAPLSPQPFGHLTPISRLTRPHSPSAYFWQGVGLSISPRPACASCCPSCSPSRPRRLPPWHNMAEDVSPVIMKRVGEHYRLFDAILGFPHIRLAFRLLF